MKPAPPADAEKGSTSAADAGTPPPARLSQLAAMAALSGTGNGIALKSGGFVLARLIVAGKPVGAVVEGSVGAALYLGMFCGSIISGWMAQRYGRRIAIGFGEAWILLISFVFGFIPGANWTVAWRAMLGIGVGVCAMCKPLYLAECAPSQIRGRVLCFFALCFPLGYLIMEFVDWFPDGGNGSYPGWWRVEICLGMVMPLLLLTLLYWMPESPSFRAEGAPAPATADDEATALMASSADSGAAAESRRRRAAFWLVVALTFAVEGCGTAGLTQFSKEMFDELEAEDADGMWSDAAYGSLFAALCIVGAITVFFLIDSTGRRPLVVGGALGLALSWVAYSASTGRWASLALVASALPAALITSAYVCRGEARSPFRPAEWAPPPLICCPAPVPAPPPPPPLSLGTVCADARADAASEPRTHARLRVCGQVCGRSVHLPVLAACTADNGTAVAVLRLRDDCRRVGDLPVFAAARDQGAASRRHLARFGLSGLSTVCSW